MNSIYDKKKLLNFVLFYTNYMENILYNICQKRKKNLKISNTNLLKIIGYK